jgi:hypothetical protein
MLKFCGVASRRAHCSSKNTKDIKTRTCSDLKSKDSQYRPGSRFRRIPNSLPSIMSVTFAGIGIEGVGGFAVAPASLKSKTISR